MRTYGIRKNQEVICRNVEKKIRRNKEKNRGKFEINGNDLSN